MIGVELYLLLDDITLFQTPKSELLENTGERIAEIREKTNGVRWQNPKDVLWNEGANGQALFEGQSVMTLSDSRARLLFDAASNNNTTLEGVPTQTELEVGPKTLVQLKRLRSDPTSNAPMLVLLERGKISAISTRSKFRVRSASAGTGADQGVEIEIASGSRFEAEKNETGEVQLRVTEGSARILGEKSSAGTAVTPGSERTLRAGESVRLSADSAEAPVIVTEPMSTTSPIATPSAEPAPSPTLSPSPEPVPTPVAKPTPKPARALPPPKMQAPILRPRAKPTPASSSLWKNRVIRTLDAVFGIRSAQAEEAEVEEFEIELRWDPVPEATGYRVQVARTRGFQPLLVDETTKDSKWIWIYRRGMENSKGRVFYRVSTIGSTGEPGDFSAPIPVVLRKTDEPMIAAKPKKEKPHEVVSSGASLVQTPIAPPRASYRITPLAQYGGFTQSTDARTLREISLSSPFFSEGFRFQYESAARALYRIDFRANHFESTSGALAKTRSFEADAVLLRAPKLWREKVAWGALISMDDQFEKSTAQTLKLRRGISVGPAFAFATGGTRIDLGIPLTGLLSDGTLGGFYGAKLSLGHRFGLFSRGSGLPSEFLTEVRGDLLFSGEPSGTRMTRWYLRLGPQWVLE